MLQLNFVHSNYKGLAHTSIYQEFPITGQFQTVHVYIQVHFFVISFYTLSCVDFYSNIVLEFNT